MTHFDNKKDVYQVYNSIADWIDDHRCKDLSLEKHYIHFIQKNIPTHGKILDVGCGTGVPIAQFFIDHGYCVTGIDASIKMIERCKKQFPNQQWILSDMRTFISDEEFDLVIAWHSFFHLPHDDQRTTLKLFTTFLEKNGLLVFTSGPEYGEVWSDNGSENLYHASLSSDEYKKILSDNDCDVLIHNINDSECGGATVWIAKKR